MFVFTLCTGTLGSSVFFSKCRWHRVSSWCRLHHWAPLSCSLPCEVSGSRAKVILLLLWAVNRIPMLISASGSPRQRPGQSSTLQQHRLAKMPLHKLRQPGYLIQVYINSEKQLVFCYCLLSPPWRMHASKAETCLAHTESDILHGAEGHKSRETQAILKNMHLQQSLKSKKPGSRESQLSAFEVGSYWESTLGALVSSKPYSRAVPQRDKFWQGPLGDQQYYGVPLAPAAGRCPRGILRVSRNRRFTSGTCWVFIFLLLIVFSYSCVSIIVIWSLLLWCIWCIFFF